MTITPTAVEPTGPAPSPPSPATRPGRPARFAALTIGGLLTLALVGYGCFALVALVARQSRTFNSTFAASSVRAVDIRTKDVAVTVEGGLPATGRPTVHAKVDFSWDQPSYSAAVDSTGTLRVNVRCGSSQPIGCNGRTTISVPRGVPVVASSSDGRIRAEHLDGSLDLHTSDGTVRVSDVSGDVKMTTSDGSIHADQVRSTRVAVGTDDGTVHLSFATVPNDVAATTSDGGVHIALPSGSGPYRLDTHTGDGSIHTSVRTDPRSARTVLAHTSDGSVTVDYDGD